jgi:integrase
MTGDFMASAPAYLCRNRHGAFYFRLVIPLRFRTLFEPPRREVRRSLHTAIRSVAVVRARACRALVDTHFQRIDESMAKKTKRSSTLRSEFITFVDGLGNTIKIDYGDLDKDIAVATAIQKTAAGLATATPTTAATTLIAPCNPGSAGPTTPLVSALSAAFLKTKTDRSQLAAGTIAEYRAAHAELIFILGDRRVGELANEDLEAFYDALLRLPRNRNAYPKYKNQTSAQLLSDEIPIAALRQAASANKIFDRVKTLLAFAVKQGHIIRNPADSVTPKADLRRARAKREPFLPEELRKIFATPHFLQRKWKSRTRPEPYRFWLLPIALLTGARQGEICQLKKGDFVHDSTAGLWYVNIVEEFDADSGDRVRSVKNQNGIRTVPISQILIDMGLLDYVERLPSPELFPELGRKGDGVDAAQKWANRYLKQCGVHKKYVKTFHSLRHNFVNNLVSRGVSANWVGAVTGHLSKEEFGSVAELAGTYFKGYEPSLLKHEVIDRLEFGDILAGVRP